MLNLSAKASEASAWPPDYVRHYAWRVRTLERLRESDKALASAFAFYSTRPVDFIEHWVDTFDPRLAAQHLPARIPFLMFPKQREMVDFILAMIDGEANGLIEKCRDMGATWICTSLSVWLWLFRDGASVGWGSRKETLVDKMGDPDSIFEKMRMTIRNLPPEFHPRGFRARDHLSWMKIINPENDSTITGEAGDNIGRGGRKLIFFKDESAHYERPERIEAALADTTRVQIDISSVSGPGSVFHRKRESGVEWRPGQRAVSGFTNLFIMDWRDHPLKSQDWYDRRRAESQRAGLLHIFAQEVERNYYAAVEGTIIQNDWVLAAIGAAAKLGIEDSQRKNFAGLDVADAGGDTNALAIRNGISLTFLDQWGERDCALTARRAIGRVAALPGVWELQYDSIGPGSSIKSEANRLRDDGLHPPNVTLVPWGGGAKVLNPDEPMDSADPKSPINKDFFTNLKAQGWWSLRRRFERTYYAVLEGGEYAPTDLISLNEDLPYLQSLIKELSQPTISYSTSMKLMVNKAPDGAKSPNLGDAVMMAYFPIPQFTYTLDNL